MEKREEDNFNQIVCVKSIIGPDSFCNIYSLQHKKLSNNQYIKHS